MKQLIEKVESNTGLTDEELLKAIEFYTMMESNLYILGTKFFIAKVYIVQVLESLKMFKRFRGI